MTLDCKLHRKMKQSRVISCAWPHGPNRTVAFLYSLLPFLAQFVTRMKEGLIFVRGRTDNSHGGLSIFVTAFPCPVRYPDEGRAYFCAWPHGPFRTVAFILSLLPFLARYCYPVKERFLFCCGAHANNLPISRNIYSAFIANWAKMDYTMPIPPKERDPSWKKTD